MKTQILKLFQGAGFVKIVLPFVYGQEVYKCEIGSVTLGRLLSLLSPEERKLAGTQFTNSDPAEEAVFCYITPLVDSATPSLDTDCAALQYLRQHHNLLTCHSRTSVAEIYKNSVEPRMKNLLNIVKNFSPNTFIPDSLSELNLEEALFTLSWLSFQSDNKDGNLNFFETALQHARTPRYKLLGGLPQNSGDGKYYIVWHSQQAGEVIISK